MQWILTLYEYLRYFPFSCPLLFDPLILKYPAKSSAEWKINILENGSNWKYKALFKKYGNFT